MEPPSPAFTLTRRRHCLGLLGLMLATITLLAVNVAAGSRLKPFFFDMTEEKIFTLSESTKRVLSRLDEPIIVRLYFSGKIKEKSSFLESYYNLVRGLLLQYVDFSDGKIKLEIIDPEPFSEEEDRAVAFGLQGVPMSESGALGYFGLAATNSIDSQEIVSFFNPEREPFLEYDLTRLIHSLEMTRRKTIGLLSTLPLDDDDQGGLEIGLQQPKESRRWLLMDQIRTLFHVHRLPLTLESLPHDIDVLLIVQPKDLPEQTLYAIDQFVLQGGRVLLFIDPVAESHGAGTAVSSFSGFSRLLESWGVRFVPDQVATNIDAARRVNAGQGMHTMITDHIAWLSLEKDSFDARDAVVGTLERVNVATAGVLEGIDGATTTLKTLISTSIRSMRLSAEHFTSSLSNVMGLVQSFRSENRRLALAVRVTGIASSAFTEGVPSGRRGQPGHMRKSDHGISLLIVADTDLLNDTLWVQKQNFFNQTLIDTVADNGTFVLNALENLSGAEALIGLRGRGRMERPFVLVETLRREAELRYRAREQALLKRIDAVQGRMRALERREKEKTQSSEKILLLMSQERKDKDIEHFRRDLLTARHELRAVKHALAKDRDIERLEGWIKAINIACVPLLLIGVAVVVSMRRRRRRLAICNL